MDRQLCMGWVAWPLWYHTLRYVVWIFKMEDTPQRLAKIYSSTVFFTPEKLGFPAFCIIRSPKSPCRRSNGVQLNFCNHQLCPNAVWFFLLSQRGLFHLEQENKEKERISNSRTRIGHSVMSPVVSSCRLGNLMNITRGVSLHLYKPVHRFNFPNVFYYFIDWPPRPILHSLFASKNSGQQDSYWVGWRKT